MNNVQFRESRDLPSEDLVALYRANGWSSAEKPELLNGRYWHRTHW